MYIKLFDELIENEFKLRSLTDEIILIKTDELDSLFDALEIIESNIKENELRLIIYVFHDELEIIIKHY